MNLNLLPEDERANFLKLLSNIKKAVESDFVFLDLDATTKDELFQKALDKYLEKENINIESLPNKLKTYLHNEYVACLKSLLKKDNNKELLDNFTNYFLQNNNNVNSKEDLLVNFSYAINSLMPDISFEECLYLTQNKNVNKLIQDIIYIDDVLDTDKLNYLLGTNSNFLLEPFCSNNNIPLEIKKIEDDLELDEDYPNLENKSYKDSVLTDDIFYDFMSRIPKNILTPEEEKIYFDRVKNNDLEARDYIIMHNQKLIVSIARKYLGQGLSLMDLIEEGNIGLMKAIEKYDNSKGYKFSTYATWWIRQAISRSIVDTGRMIRLPVYMNVKLAKIKKINQKLNDTLGREASDKELARELKMSQKELTELLNKSSEVISYNLSVSEDEKDGAELQDYIIDKKIQIEEDYVLKDLKRFLFLSLENNLTEREEFIIRERFGFDDGKPKTLEEIGKKLKITRERVRQLENKALKKLRSDKSIKENLDYLDYSEENDQKATTLFVRIGNYKKAYVLEAIKYLEVEEQDYLKNIYGNDYNKRAQEIYEKKFIDIMSKLLIFTLAFKNSDKVKVITDDLLSLLEVEEEELKALLEKLTPYDQKILKKKYPNGFDKRPNVLDKPLENYCSKVILPSLYKLKKEIAKNRRQKEREITKVDDGNIVISKDSLKEAFKLLSEDEQRFILSNYEIKRYEVYSFSVLEKISTEPTYQKLLLYAKNIEYTGHFDLDIKEVPFIALTTAQNIEELTYHLSYMKRDKVLLKRRFGEDFIHEKELNSVSYPQHRKIMVKIIPRLNEQILALRMPLENILNVDISTIKIAISYFPWEQQRLLNNFYNYVSDDLTFSVGDYAALENELIPTLKLAVKDLMEKKELSLKTNALINKIKNYNNLQKLDFNQKQVLSYFSNKDKEILINKYDIQNIKRNEGVNLEISDQNLILLQELYEKALTFFNENGYLSEEIIKEIENISNTKVKFSVDNATLLKVVSTLPENEQRIVYKKYGEHLDGRGGQKLDAEEAFLYGEISKKISKLLSNMKRTKKNKKASFKADKNVVFDIVNDLSEQEQQLFYKRFDSDLNVRENIELTADEKEQYLKLSRKISSKINLHNRKIENQKSLKFKADKATLLRIVSNFSPQEQQIFFKRNGSNLDDIDEARLTIEEKELYKKICFKISYHLLKMRKDNNLNNDELVTRENSAVNGRDWSNIKTFYSTLDEERKSLLGINNRTLLDYILGDDIDISSLNIKMQRDIYNALKVLFMTSKDNPQIVKRDKIYLKSLRNYLNNS